MASSRPPRRRKIGVAAGAAVAVFLLGALAGGQIGHRRPGLSVPPPLNSSAAAGPSSQSAVEAAAGYATVMAQLFPMPPDQAEAVLAADASDGYRATLTQSVDTVLLPLQQQVAELAGNPVYRESVLATRVVSYVAPRAEVTVWVMVVAGQSGVADNAVCSFELVDLQLVWQRGAWRIDGTSEQPGPSPQLSGAPTSVDQLVASLAGFNDWRPR